MQLSSNFFAKLNIVVNDGRSTECVHALRSDVEIRLFWTDVWFCYEKGTTSRFHFVVTFVFQNLRPKNQIISLQTYQHRVFPETPSLFTLNLTRPTAACNSLHYNFFEISNNLSPNRFKVILLAKQPLNPIIPQFSNASFDLK